MVRSALIVLILIAGASMPPAAGAPALLLSEATPVQGTLQVAAAHDAFREGSLLFSGALDYQNAVRGAVFGMDTRTGTVFTAHTVRVYNVHDPISIATQRPVFEASGGRITATPGTSFFWSVPQANISGASAHAFAFLVALEARFADSGILPARDGPPPLSLVTQAGETWTVDAAGANRSLLMPITGELVVAGADGSSATFTGSDWLISLRGDTRAEIIAEGIAVPFEPGHTVGFERADDAVFAATFSVDRLRAFLSLAARLGAGFEPPQVPPEGVEPPCAQDPAACQGQNTTRRNATSPPPQGPVDVLTAEAADAIARVAPFLNGGMFGEMRGSLVVSNETLGAPGFTLVRFERFTLEASDAGTVAIAGTSPFTFASGDVQHDTATFRIGPLVIPLLSLFLWFIAAGAYVAGRVGSLREPEAERTSRLVAPALITQWGLLLVSFLLFDREVHYVLGQSLLGAMGAYAGAAVTASLAAVGIGMVLLIQLALWGAASVAFGVPVAIIGRAGLRMAGIGRGAFGFAVGLGALATWLLGTAIILPVLDVFFGAVAGA